MIKACVGDQVRSIVKSLINNFSHLEKNGLAGVLLLRLDNVCVNIKRLGRLVA